MPDPGVFHRVESQIFFADTLSAFCVLNKRAIAYITMNEQPFLKNRKMLIYSNIFILNIINNSKNIKSIVQRYKYMSIAPGPALDLVYLCINFHIPKKQSLSRKISQA